MARSSPRGWLLAWLLLAGAAAASGAGEAADLVADLRRALRGASAEEKVVALGRVERGADRLAPAERREAAVAVRRALEGAEPEAVREAAIHALARLGGATGWVPVILDALDGRDPVRRDAARQAVLWGQGDYLAVVARLLVEDQDPTFRARLALLLGDRRRRDAVPLLLDALGDGHRRVASAAAEALEAVTGLAHGLDAAAWRAAWAAVPAPAADPAVASPTLPADRPTLAEPPPHATRSLVPVFYGLRLPAKDLVFVVDVSGSVGAGGVARARRELVEAVETLGSDVRVAALFFDEEVRMWRPEMAPATPANKADLARFLRAVRPGRRTDLFTPLNAGLRIVERRLAERRAAGEAVPEAITMVVVSDGVETARQTPPAVVAERLERLDPAHTVVHAVALGGRPSAVLLELARRGGGHYVQVP